MKAPLVPGHQPGGILLRLALMTGQHAAVDERYGSLQTRFALMAHTPRRLTDVRRVLGHKVWELIAEE